MCGEVASADIAKATGRIFMAWVRVPIIPIFPKSPSRVMERIEAPIFVGRVYVGNWTSAYACRASY